MRNLLLTVALATLPLPALAINVGDRLVNELRFGDPAVFDGDAAYDPDRDPFYKRMQDEPTIPPFFYSYSSRRGDSFETPFQFTTPFRFAPDFFRVGSSSFVIRLR